MRFNPPPNWPPMPPGFVPAPGWLPDPAWGEPPHGWPLWVEDSHQLAPAPTQVIVQQPKKGKGAIGCLSVIVVVLVVGAIGAAASHKKPTSNTPAPAAPAVVLASDGPADDTPAAPAFTEPAAPVDPDAAHPAMADVTVNSCSIDGDTHWASCKITVLNHSSKTSNYIITMSAESPDHATKYGDMIAAVNDLAPGQSSPQTCQGFNDVPAGSISVLTQVERYASAG